MKTIAFFSNRGRGGKTTLAYHLAWMYADRGIKVAIADLDPQANLTSLLLDEDRLEELWPDSEHSDTILGAIAPILRGTGAINPRHVEDISDNIGLVVGDIGLSLFEEKLATAWSGCVNEPESALRSIAAFYGILKYASDAREADLTLVDVGPNLSAINRAALLAADHLVVPLSPDLFNLQGLRTMGPALRDWRTGWAKRLSSAPSIAMELPAGRISAAGYVLLRPTIRMDRPVQAYGRWMSHIPGAYLRAVLDGEDAGPQRVADDPECLAQVKRYPSLMPMALEARKPMFFLKPADGAIGAHAGAVTQCYHDFRALAESIARRVGIELS
ncbi:MAG TPA: ParA family protein [Armatimonadota bacterium]|nr:ParA family protein [Armatimonadota bacterium]